MAPYDLINEKLLFQRISKGDQSAFEQIFNRYRDKVYHFILGFTHSAADAEEILQDAFLILWEKKGSLANVDHPRNYIYTIVKNKTFNFLKKASKSSRLREEIWSNMIEAQNATEELLNLTESNQLINEALNQLAIKKQEVFRMSRYDGLSHEEIAAQTGLSKSRVKNIIVEVVKYIKAYLMQYTSILLLILFFLWKEEIFSVSSGPFLPLNTLLL